MMRTCRIGIIGCGWAGAQHAQAIGALADRAELVGVADVDAGVAERQARAWNVPVWTDNYHTLLAGHALDAVSICLPSALHASVAIDACRAGVHVLVEKPLATSLAEADAMIAAADEARVQLLVAENMRYDPSYRKMAELIAADTLGDIFLLRIAREHEMHDYLRRRPWFLHQPSGGIMYSGGIHDFELLRMLGGEIEHVYALAAPKTLPEMAGDDTSVALAGLRSGALATIVESFSLKTPEPSVQVTAHGSRGSLWCRGEHLRLYDAPEDGRQDLVHEMIVPAHNTFELEIAHFLDCVEGKAEPITGAREERKPLVAVLAAYESMRRGERVYLTAVRGDTEG